MSVDSDKLSIRGKQGSQKNSI